MLIAVQKQILQSFWLKGSWINILTRQVLPSRKAIVIIQLVFRFQFSPAKDKVKEIHIPFHVAGGRRMKSMPQVKGNMIACTQEIVHFFGRKRSEERRVGKECRSGWWTQQSQEK